MAAGADALAASSLRDWRKLNPLLLRLKDSRHFGYNPD